MDKDFLPLDLYSASQVRELDKYAIEELRIPGICLMERAGSACFDILKSRWPKAERIAVLCGIGNNAGDGYVLARLAHLAGYHTIVLQVGDTKKLKCDARTAFESMLKVDLMPLAFTHELFIDIQVDVIVDALFGTGLDREVSGIWREVIEALNLLRHPVLSIDIPSGLQADTGSVLGVAVRAEATVSFIGLKQGLLTGKGRDYCGELYFNDLQVPKETYKSLKSTVGRLYYDILGCTLLTKRPRAAHKGTFGHVLIIGGDSGMIGAARLAAEAATRVGAGLVSVATRAAHAPLLNLTRPEIMTHGVETAEQLAPLLDKANVVVIGPGLGQSTWARTLFEAVKELKKPIVVDADALNLLAQKPFRFDNSVLTPHPGEAARLLEMSTDDIQANRFAAVQALQERFGGICVLKGAGTLIAAATNDHQIDVCTDGNPGMACGGMGDVLTGVIAGLLAQGIHTLGAVKLGVCLHAKAGDRAAVDGERGLLASDLLPWLRYYANPDLRQDHFDKFRKPDRFREIPYPHGYCHGKFW
ncbi:MAG: bifunctional ADP-dependent NAD(P)H-hydrate dehydratase/NAD(P)H-hydrate epimerase [Gammaproteobacteria bacterium]|nr:MAG: bifunctional ADP-dependent NAD(P)H-hydrate dehydratase/NAD(P)H-hydrate epimerase [Gammaproteobacteria bacterium]RKZ40897.1 MAG: bifunctional ADP-dependent NAD(P)H-hydrate dehydratase/NAD(P)H-hydrate epimerase [Gammaproteobacteria bacterium]